jgi:hypothetical protein
MAKDCFFKTKLLTYGEQKLKKARQIERFNHCEARRLRKPLGASLRRSHNICMRENLFIRNLRKYLKSGYQCNESAFGMCMNCEDLLPFW